MSNPGMRVKRSFPRPDRALVEAFASIPVANIGDNMNRLSCMNARVRPMNKGRLLGCAFTVKVRAGDNLLFHKAIDMAQPGDIIVIDAQNEQSYAIFGELMVMWLRRRGVTGVVVDGCIRDYDCISELDDIAIYATGITPNGPLKEGGGEINFPVMCGGLVVCPGDIIVGDSDGVVVINPADAPDVLKKALAHNAKEAQTMKDIENMAWGRSWVDETLIAKGCQFID
ncbi:MAG: 4-hydroxy-4-methyl-2-oxoglutarate aldolase/4-carboxy-4-hydroxy-2-oxoadipate aldolase [Desulfovibrio sp.]